MLAANASHLSTYLGRYACKNFDEKCMWIGIGSYLIAICTSENLELHRNLGRASD